MGGKQSLIRDTCNKGFIARVFCMYTWLSLDRVMELWRFWLERSILSTEVTR